MRPWGLCEARIVAYSVIAWRGKAEALIGSYQMRCSTTRVRARVRVFSTMSKECALRSHGGHNKTKALFFEQSIPLLGFSSSRASFKISLHLHSILPSTCCARQTPNTLLPNFSKSFPSSQLRLSTVCGAPPCTFHPLSKAKAKGYHYAKRF